MYGIVREDRGDLLQQIDHLKAWRMVLGFHVEPYQLITSPFRADANPSCYLSEYKGVLLFTDWAFTEYNKYTVIHAIAHLSGSSFREAYWQLYEWHWYGKAIQVGSITCTSVTRKVNRLNGKDIFFEPFYIDGKPAYTTADRDYWSKRNITYPELFNGNQGCYSVRYLLVNGYSKPPKTYPCYALTFNNSDHFKVYCPLNSKEERFPMSTATKDDYWKWGHGTSECVITKSFKDGVLIHKLTGLDTYAFQSESMLPTNLEVLSHYDKRVIVYDNDAAGITGSNKVKAMFDTSFTGNNKQVWYPEALGKDTDDMVVKGYGNLAKSLIMLSK